MVWKFDIWMTVRMMTRTMRDVEFEDDPSNDDGDASDDACYDDADADADVYDGDDGGSDAECTDGVQTWPAAPNPSSRQYFAPLHFLPT